MEIVSYLQGIGLPVEPEGSGFKLKTCPLCLHHDCFKISPEGFFKCFSCNAAGDAAKFESLRNGISCREAELCNLEISKINFQNNTVFVTGKGQKDRLILISDRLKEKIQLYLSNRMLRYLFESNRGTRFSTRRIQQLCAQYKALADIQTAFTPHTCRHIFFTRLCESGISKEYRKLLAGHSSDRSQEIYVNLGISGIAPEILSALDKLGF